MRRSAALFGLMNLAVPAVGHAQEIASLSTSENLAPNLLQAEDRDRAVGCLATAIAYEAGYESVEGQQAVAEVILNRLRHAAFPKTVCGVVFAGSQRRTGCQFSFTCDGSLNRRLSTPVMTVTRTIAMSALDGLNPVRVAGATHYHADYVSPYWAPSLIRIAKIGAHIFYRGAGGRDQMPGAQPYVPSGEPSIAALGNAKLLVAGRPVAPAAAPARAQVFAPWGLTPSAPPTSPE